MKPNVIPRGAKNSRVVLVITPEIRPIKVTITPVRANPINADGQEEVQFCARSNGSVMFPAPKNIAKTAKLTVQMFFPIYKNSNFKGQYRTLFQYVNIKFY